MRALIVSVFLITFGIESVWTQIPAYGLCPDVVVEEDFDINSYMGKWFEYARYPFVYEVARKCNTVYYKKDDRKTISISNESIDRYSGKKKNTTGTAKLRSSGKLSVSFRDSDPPRRPNYYILGTDYNNYAIIFSCREMGIRNSHIEMLWILTRKRKPSRQIISEAFEVIDANSLSRSSLAKTEQENCGNDYSTNGNFFNLYF
ncbi:hypothetical protein ACFFRR_005291 [Megaselia abdita]